MHLYEIIQRDPAAPSPSSPRGEILHNCPNQSDVMHVTMLMRDGHLSAQSPHADDLWTHFPPPDQSNTLVGVCFWALYSDPFIYV